MKKKVKLFIFQTITYYFFYFSTIAEKFFMSLLTTTILFKMNKKIKNPS